MATRTYDGKTTDIYDTNLDPTRQAQAMSQADVNAQDYATRLWQSLKNAYTRKMENSDQGFDNSIGTTDRTFSGKGMGRSSYLAATLANLEKQKNDARSDIFDQLIADYQSQVTSQDNADRQLASSYVSAIISAGGTPSDDLLRRAGLSREDALAMLSQSGGGGRGGNGGNGGDDQKTQYDQLKLAGLGFTKGASQITPPGSLWADYSAPEQAQIEGSARKNNYMSPWRIRKSSDDRGALGKYFMRRE